MKYVGYVLLFFLMVGISPAKAIRVAHHGKKVKQKQAFDCPQIVETGMFINPSSCNINDGSITGISATGNGTVSYLWYDKENDVISKTSDLLNVGAGVYTLVVKDDSKCPAVKKPYIVGTKNGVSIDDASVVSVPSSCKTPDGSIAIAVQHATKFAWYNEGGKQVGFNQNLTKVPSGLYKLVASNDDGCSATGSYAVSSKEAFPIPETQVDTIFGSCNYSQNSVKVKFFPPDNGITYTYAVKDDAGNQVGDDSGPIGGGLSYANGEPVFITVPAGLPGHPNYIYIYDANSGCPSVAGSYESPLPTFSISTVNALVRNDACGRHTGGVFHLSLIGATKPEKFFGTPPNQVWTWTDSVGTVITHLPDLTDVTKGTYHLTVVDTHGCRDTRTFMVNDSTAEAFPPVLGANTTLCLPATTTISVVKPGAKLGYRLYDSTQTAITENKFGIFQVFAAQTSTYYVTTLDALCESEKTPYKVTVIAPGVIIPNTFTPNNDGINDYWTIPHINQFPGAEVSVFNRDGQLIYHSIDYSKPFDGKYNGALLPSGVYYYIIDLKQPECLGKVSGNVTIIR